jgi:hypothetical protein
MQSNMQSNMQNNMLFKNTWNLWVHHNKDVWDVSGYKKLYTINNALDFWKLFNSWEEIDGLLSKQFFLMKNNITPIWEDEQNKNGGCWSLKVIDYEADDLFELLSVLMVSEELSNLPDTITGLSICLKKNNTVVIKIWNNNKNNSNIDLLNKKIFDIYNDEIIYIANNPNH